jgi:hypothetical protein
LEKPSKTIKTLKILSSALLVLALPIAGQAQFMFSTNNGTLTLTNYFGPGGGAVVIPSTNNGLPVTSIGVRAFSHLYGPPPLSAVVIPDTVTNIQDYAFYDCPVYNVTIPGSVISIGNWAFGSCQEFSSINIPNGVTAIGNRAFDSCRNLTNFTIPQSVTNVGVGPFAFCDSLVAINVDTNNPAYTSVNGVLLNRPQTLLVQYPPAKAGASYSISNGVTSIGDFAFVHDLNPTLTSVTIPNSVTSIGNYAFDGSGLTNVTISGSVTNMGVAPFASCASLPAINVSTDNPAYVSVNGVLYNADMTTLVQYPQGKAGTSYVIPNGVTSIGGNAFSYCLLANVTIPNGVGSIGYAAFAGCDLTTITIPNSVTTIGDYAFNYCFLLATVYVADNAPTNADLTAFSGDTGTVYSLPGTTGWGAVIPYTFLMKPWLLPYPVILTGTPTFGVQSNQFGFLVSWATNASIIVDACTDMANPVWQPVATNALSNGTFYFSDPQWSNFLRRFYRVQTP